MNADKLKKDILKKKERKIIKEYINLFFQNFNILKHIIAAKIYILKVSNRINYSSLSRSNEHWVFAKTLCIQQKLKQLHNALHNWIFNMFILTAYLYLSWNHQNKLLLKTKDYLISRYIKINEVNL